MKQNNKTDRIKAWIIFWIGIFFVFIIMTITSSEKFYCQKNPQDCVWQSSNEYGELELRKKTQAELDVDDCNSNPREDEKCKCELTKKEYYDLQCKDHYNNIWVYRENVTENISNSYPDGKSFTGCIVGIKNHCSKSRPKTDWEKHPENYVLDCSNAQNLVMIKVNSSPLNYYDCPNGRDCNCYWRKKNECEKGNPDWVEENKIKYSLAKLGYPEIITSFCDESYTFCMGDGCNEFLYLGWWDTNLICSDLIFNQTICREKTDVEKYK